MARGDLIFRLLDERRPVSAERDALPTHLWLRHCRHATQLMQRLRCAFNSRERRLADPIASASMPPSRLSRIASYARGTDCGAHIVDWRNRLLPLTGGILLLVGGELVLRSFAERAR